MTSEEELLAERGPYTSSGGDSQGELPPRMPRWVKVSAIVVGFLVLLFLVLQLAGIGGEHGPGRHVSGQGTPLESVSSDRAAIPAGLR